MTSSKTLEESVKDSAERIVFGKLRDGSDHYHNSSMRSEMDYLIAMVRSLLVVEVNTMRSDQKERG
jgi:hypothetical protein